METPEGWNNDILGNLFDFKNGANTEAKNYGSGLKFVNVMDVFENQSLTREKIRGTVNLPERVNKIYLLKMGDVLFNRTSETFDEIALTTVYLDTEPAIFGGFVIRGRPKTSKLNPHFCVYCFSSSTVRKESIRRGQGVIRSNIGQVDLRRVPLLVPPLPEQKKIAEILSTWDRAIEVVERLIENSQTQKKALMQQLLTAKKRLPGFENSKWRSALLGEIGLISSAGVDKKINANEQTIRLLNFLDVFRRELIFDSDLIHEVTAPEAKIKNCNIRKGDVFFTPSSETRDEIAVSAVAAEDMQGVVYSYHVVRFRLEENWDLNFRSFVFQTDDFRCQAYRLGDGSGQRYVISQPNFRKMRVNIPSKEEQKLIGEILRNAAEEIEIQQNQLTQLKSEKSALMQQLLTGKRRVKIDKEVAA